MTSDYEARKAARSLLKQRWGARALPELDCHLAKRRKCC
jgi:hypothetical protein